MNSVSAALPVVKTTFDKVVDGICGPLLALAAVANFSNFCESRKKYMEAVWLNPAGKSVDERIIEARQKMIYEGIGAVGMTSSLLGWTFVVGLLPPLGIASIFFNAVGFGAAFIVSAKGASDAARKFTANCENMHERRLALFDLATKVTFAAWAVLGAIALFTGAVSFSVVGVLLMATFSSIFLESFYKEAYQQRNGTNAAVV